jgi:NADH-quinone oxidoreductase subunit J
VTVAAVGTYVVSGALSPPRLAATEIPAEGGNLETVALALFRHYLLPFEVVSLLLLVAMVGAILLAKPKI